MVVKAKILLFYCALLYWLLKSECHGTRQGGQTWWSRLNSGRQLGAAVYITAFEFVALDWMEQDKCEQDMLWSLHMHPPPLGTYTSWFSLGKATD